jgi:lipopolysaccharide export LptBFGC system permease protein LptF
VTRLARYLLTPWALLSLLTVVAVAVMSVALTVVSSLRWVAAASSLEVGQWVLLQVPAVLVTVLPLAPVFVSALILGAHHRQGTFVAIAAGGIPPRSVLWPWLGVLLLGSALSFVLSEWLRPAAERTATVLWWSLTDDRSPAHRLQRRDLVLPDGFSWRFEGYDDATDTLRLVRVTRFRASVSEVWRAPAASWDGGTLTLYDAEWVRLDLELIDREGMAGVSWARFAEPLPLPLPEVRLETQARYSSGTVGDGRSWSRQRLVAADPWAPAVERAVAARRAAEMLVSALGVTLLGGVAVWLLLRRGGSQARQLLVAGGMGVGWLALSAIGYGLALSGGLPPSLGPWLPLLLPFALAFAAWRGKSVW